MARLLGRLEGVGTTVEALREVPPTQWVALLTAQNGGHLPLSEPYQCWPERRARVAMGVSDRERVLSLILCQEPVSHHCIRNRSAGWSRDCTGSRQVRAMNSPRVLRESTMKAQKSQKNRAQRQAKLRDQELAPVAIGVRSVSEEPKISRTARSMRIAHKELVGASVAGSTTFTVQNALALNPGLAATFPWLAPQAQQWEQYSCRRLALEWVPIAPTSTQGDVIISPDYDASDPQPTSEVQATNNYGAVTDSCWKRLMVELDVAAMMGLGPRKFVRPAAVAGDPKTFDLGKLFVCTNNETGTSAIGKFFLHYDFEFFVPQNSPNPDSVPLQTSVFYNNSNVSLTNGVWATIPWDTTVYDPLSLGNASGTFTPPAGVYRIHAIVDGEDTASEAFDINVQILKNGSAVNGSVHRNGVGVAQGATNMFSVATDFVLACNGTDTFEIQAKADGAAGTLVAVNKQVALVVSLA